MKIRILSVILYLSTLNGCGGSGEAASSSSEGPPPVGTVVQSAMGVDVYAQSLFPYNLSLSTDFDTKCEIASTASSQDIVCYADVNELDLYYNGIQFQYNIPAGMCDYVGIDNYYYYAQEVGMGPTHIDLSVSYDSDNLVTGSSCTVTETRTPAVGGPNGVTTTNPCLDTDEVDFDLTDASFRCVYDRSHITGFANCCFGNYTATIVRNNNGSISTSNLSQSWGGTFGSCVHGVFTDAWPTLENGRPARLLEYSVAGLNKLLVIKEPIKGRNNGYNILASNFYTPATHLHAGYYSATTSTRPYAINPIDDRNGTLLSATELYSAQDSYSFLCLDKDYEVKNRIQVYVREWNTYAQFLSYIDTEGASGNPDVSGSEPCTGVGISGSCNDFPDWDDIGNLNPNYPTNPATDLSDRINYFPYDD